MKKGILDESGSGSLKETSKQVSPGKKTPKTPERTIDRKAHERAALRSMSKNLSEVMKHA